MVGAKFMACKPSATPHDDCEITYFYLPWDCTAQDLIDIAFGEVTYPWIETVQNFSAAYAMSAPIERFPRCALVMLMDSSTKDDQRGSVYFKLWHQTENSVELLELEHTNSPFSAAEQAKQLGYSQPSTAATAVASSHFYPPADSISYEHARGLCRTFDS